MSEPCLLSKVAELLRPVSKDVFNGKGKLCLSTLYLQKLNSAFDEHVPEDLSSSFNVTDTKAHLQRDLHFLLDLVTGTVALKLTPDLIGNEEQHEISLGRFGNLKALEIHKIDVKTITGIQKLRPQIQELTNVHNLGCLGDVLDKCGGDMSQGHLWSELKKANFSHNHITEIDNSLEWTPWLVTLDLSHNQLKSADFVNTLPNLKHLNVSFNKLDKVPKFKGQICKRLQVLILSNNFVEDLTGLINLSTLLQLDLSQNCLMDHNSLMSIAHLPSLYFLNLQGNPVYFHPHHRNTTCQYLNKNTATLNFVLNNIPLNKAEKSFAGSRHPITQSSLSSSNDSSLNSLENSVHERQRRVRNVTIREGHSVVAEPKKTPVSTPKPSTVHLEMKKQVEQLRKEYGDTWLYRHSGVIFQDVLGFEKSTVLSSTPSENHLGDLYFAKNEASNDSGLFETAKEEQTTTDAKENFETAEDSDFFISHDEPAVEEEEEPLSDDDDAFNGEMFYAATGSDGKECDLCLIVTETHLSERDSVSVKEKARWNLNVVISCEVGSLPNEIQITFDTMRKDRQSRTYYIEDTEKFVNLVQSKIVNEKIDYQCMKCNESFSRTKSRDRRERESESSVVCPKCQSIHVIEV